MADVDAFFSRLNPLMRLILRSPLHWAVSSGLALITVTGRRTGHPYTIPVGYQRDGDVIVIMVSQAARKQWWRNFRKPGSVGLVLCGREHAGTAWVVEPISAEFRERCETTFRRLPVLGAQFGIRFDRKTGLSEEQLAHLRASCAVVRIDLADATGSGDGP